MAGESELKGLGTIECSECERTLPLKVCKSAAGWYLGHWCPECGPYSRGTGYFATEQQAEEALKLAKQGKPVSSVRTTDYLGN